MDDHTTPITEALRAWHQDIPGATEELISLVYRELRHLAARALHREREGHSLSPTALVHETYVRLLEQKQVDWQNRQHFFSICARLMRRILVDHARGRLRAKRGGQWQRVTLEDQPWLAVDNPEELLAVDEALTELAQVDRIKADIVELRFFAGLTVAETAGALGISVPTVVRHWRLARAWLFRRIYGDGPPPGAGGEGARGRIPAPEAPPTPSANVPHPGGPGANTP